MKTKTLSLRDNKASNCLNGIRIKWKQFFIEFIDKENLIEKRERERENLITKKKENITQTELKLK